MVLSSVVILLVSSTFLVQNNYYATQTQLTGAHDNARVATELVATELRSTMRDGIVVAGAGTLTVRSPMAVGVICDRSGAGEADVYTEGGQQALTTSEIAGIAVRDSVTGDWTYAGATWGTLDRSDVSSAANCFANGADTVGARADYHRVGGLNALFGTTPSVGDVFMLFRETTFKIQTSELDPSGLGLFRGVQGGVLVEFATGMDPTARFRYRTGGGTYVDTVTAGSLDDIDFVRVEAGARKPARTGGREDITFGWAVNIPVRNAG